MWHTHELEPQHISLPAIPLCRIQRNLHLGIFAVALLVCSCELSSMLVCACLCSDKGRSELLGLFFSEWTDAQVVLLSRAGLEMCTLAARRQVRIDSVPLPVHPRPIPVR